ncbi:Hydrophobin 2 [Mycena chlorophos]|uniref:Hydrophobin n=1 Tax=Mycena chlorophos TaxID=658473 RepID=A0A8H6SXF9_MYCCL|nr:Hydrophobin 2 [Mycena chlorophos]
MFFKLFAVFAISPWPWRKPEHRALDQRGALAVAAPSPALDLTGLDVPIGLSCSPITVAGNNCSSTQPSSSKPANDVLQGLRHLRPRDGRRRRSQQHPDGYPAQPAQCCDSVVSPPARWVSLVAALVGLDLSGLNVPIGLSCSPITIIGNNCGGTVVNCDSPTVEDHNLIAINCLPITL